MNDQLPVNVELRVGQQVMVNIDEDCLLNVTSYNVDDTFWTACEGMKFSWHTKNEDNLVGVIIQVDESKGRHKYNVQYCEGAIVRPGIGPDNASFAYVWTNNGWYARTELFDELDAKAIAIMFVGDVK